VPKIVKIGECFTSLSEKIKVAPFMVYGVNRNTVIFYALRLFIGRKFVRAAKRRSISTVAYNYS